MKMQQRPIAPLVRAVLLGIGGTATLLTTLGALAQSDAGLEEIVVTGSRVRGVAPVGSTVITLDRDDMNASGKVTVDRMIKDIPQNFDLGVTENTRAQSGGNGNIVFGNTVNLRGIGPYATLILVDGHRVISNSRSIDPSTLPALGVERIEVVADGASAIYGSDAIAGVVNIIPRRNFEGIEAFARTGLAESGDFDESVLGLAVGKRWQRGRFMLAYEHAFRDNLSGDDRFFFRSDQTAEGGRDYRVMRCDPGTIRVGSTSYAIPSGGVTPANAASLVAGSANRCDELVGQDLFPKQKYDTINGTGDFQFNNWLEGFFDGFWSKRRFERYPAYTNVSLTVPTTNAWFVAPPGFSGTNYLLDYSFRNDLPRDVADGFARSWEVTPGLRIRLPRDWQFEALFTYGKNHDEANSYYGLNQTALTAALASSNPATAFDPYGLHRTASSVLAGIANQIFLAPTLNEFIGYEARFNGKLFELPGGSVALAAGYERQDQEVDLGSARGNPGTAIVYRHFERQVDSVYAELLLPLFGPGNARPGLELLQISAAIRYDDYSDVGHTTNPKIGITWEPIDNLTIRGSYGTSFRAPLISQIYGNSNNFFGQSQQNPAGGPPLPSIAYSGPNLNLTPEEATTWSIGADWQPLDALRLSLTYFDIEYENQVETYLSNTALLSREAEFAGTGVILRGTAARDRVLELLAQGVTLARGSFPGGNPNNVTLFTDGRNLNLGISNTRGLDFAASYAYDTARYGSFQFSINGTYLTKYQLAITPAAPFVDFRDTIFNPLKFKARAGIGWDYRAVRSQLTLNYVGGYDNIAVTPREKVASYTPVDLSVSWQIGDPEGRGLLDALTLGFDVRNLFDEDPPYVNIAPGVNGSGGYDATATNPVGRLFGLSLRKKW